MMDTIKKFSKNNSGIAMVSVMVVCTVCLLVATIVLEITYTSLLSRKVYKVANNTKYTAESTVDDMESVIQNIAYYAVEKKGGGDQTFISLAKEVLMENAGVTSFSTQDDYDKLADYIFSNLDEKNRKMLGVKNVGAGNVVTYTRDPKKFVVKAIDQSVSVSDNTKDALAISVFFKYEDERGFVSEITTDLVLNDITSRKAASDYSLGSYSMFTGGGVRFEGNVGVESGRSLYFQEGNAYVGTMASEAPKAMEIDGCVVDFSGAAIVNGDVYIKNNGALIFSAGKDGEGNRTEITIKGTVYVDDSSSLTINKDLDFVCKDIILTDGSNSWSAFDASKNCYGKKASVNSYLAEFPYNSKDVAGLALSKTEMKNNMVVGDFKEGKIGGCLLISDGQNAKIAKRTSTGFTYLGGAASGALINKDPNCIPEAKATIWTYDNNSYTVDSEMSTFVNVPLLYAQKNIFPNTSMHAQYARIINHTNSSSIIRTNYTQSLGGNALDKMTIVNGASTTAELISSGGISNSDVQNTDGININSFLGKNITLGTNTLKKVVFRVGNVQDCSENLTSDDAAVAFVNVWNAYTVQFNGGSIVGIIMSADKCLYKILGNNRITTAYSILNAKDIGNDTAKTDMDKMIDNLQYCIFMRNVNNSTQHNTANGNTYQNYGLYMLDSLFTGGMKSFTSDGGGSSGGSMTVDSKNMYDFITVENWTQS